MPPEMKRRNAPEMNWTAISVGLAVSYIHLNINMKIMPTAYASSSNPTVVNIHAVTTFGVLSGFFLRIDIRRFTGAVRKNPIDPAAYAQK